MGTENTAFYIWNFATDLVGLTGFLIGYVKIGRSLEGAVLGYILIKVVQYLVTPLLLGVIL